MVLYLERGGKKRFYFQFAPLAVLLVVLFFLFGGRDELTGADTNAYLWQFDNYDWINYGIEQGLYFTYLFLNKAGLPSQSILYFFAFFYLLAWALAIRRWSRVIGAEPLLIFFTLFSLFFFKSMGINVIRQGLSLAFLLASLSFIFVPKKNRIIAFVLLAVALSFHFSSVMAVLLFMGAYWSRRVDMRILLLLYAVTVVLAAANIGILAFKDVLGSLIVQEGKSDYLTNESELYTVGFKPQFVAFNTIFLLLFLYLRKKVNFTSYEILLRFFILSSCIFFLAFQIPYSDRWGLIGWVAIPFLLSPVYSNRLPRGWMVINTLFLIAVFIFFELTAK